jgi:hypothetical protein
MPDFFGRPRFRTKPSLLVVGLPIEAIFFPFVDPDGRPRFFIDETSFEREGAAAIFFVDDPNGRPRFLLTGSLLLPT